MPRLNLLRAHRRYNSSHPSSPPPGPPPTAPLTPPPPPASAPPRAARLDALPPLDVGSPDLGSPGQWLGLTLSHEPGPSQSQSTIATTAPSISQASRTSTPYTAITSELSPTPVPHVPRPASRPKTAVATAASTIPTVSTGRYSPGPPAMPPPPPPQAATAERERPQQHHRESSYTRRKEKLNLLNPMSLLRRRSSQASIQLEKERLRRELPDDFDPGIIYGTRHPDWSNPPKRRESGEGTGALSPPVNGRSVSPMPPLPPIPQVGESGPVVGNVPDGKMLRVLEVASPGVDQRIEVERTPKSVFKEDFGDPSDKVKPPTTTIDITPPPLSPPANSPPPPPPPRPVEEEKLDVVKRKDAPTARPEPTPPVKNESSDSDDSDDGERRRGVTLVDHPLSLPHHMLSNSSRFSFEASSTGPSATGSCAASHQGEDLSDVEEDSFQFDLADDGDDEEGFGRANEDILGFEDSIPALQDAVRALELNKQQQKQGIGLAVTTEGKEVKMANGTEVTGGENKGLGLTGVNSGVELPTMEPVAVQPGDPTAGKPITLAARRRIANPRNLDLSDDSDLDFDNERGIGGYEDEDDDLYYDDGIINDNFVYEEPPSVEYQTNADLQTNDTATAEPEAAQLQLDINSPDIKPDPLRLSITTTQGVTSSGGAMVPEDGSAASAENAPVQSFPPFINPIGGGLGYTQQNSQFYTPQPSVLNGYSLNSLTYTLQQYQQQQAQLEGYDSESDLPEFGTSAGGYFSGVDDFEGGMDDDDIIAAANAEALANDTDGFYGQEFSMFQNHLGNGNISGQAGVLRAPALTPISERSENSYRNSLVFPSQWSAGGLSSPQGILSASLGSGEGEGELSLEGLMRYRRSAWGGSNVSLPSSGASVDGSAGTSPVDNRLPGLVTTLPSPGFENASPGIMQQMSPPPSFSPPGIPSPLGLPPGLGSPPGLNVPPGLSHPAHGTPPPPGLAHAGGNAMLPTKGSFDETMLAGMGIGMKTQPARVPEEVEEEDAGYASGGRPSTETVSGVVRI